jgi:response regulator of citrate/malate metabolism
MATILERDKRYHVCGGAHGFYNASELIRKHHPDVLLIEPFLEDRDGIRWIKDLPVASANTRCFRLRADQKDFPILRKILRATSPVRFRRRSVNRRKNF